MITYIKLTNMKKIIILSLLYLVLFSCQDKYEFDADFTIPTELNSPSAIELDVTSTEAIVLSWEGGSALDGGIVLYEILFDKSDGDFSSPLATVKSNQGALTSLTISHSSINTIARRAGILPLETGELKWTVLASKGGVVKAAGVEKVIKITRGEGIDNIPEFLYLYGTATENDGKGGIPFRTVEEGVFQIYTTLKAGNISFKSSVSADAFSYYIDDSNRLREGDDLMLVESSDDVVRITVDFGTMSMKIDNIGSSVRCIWGATFSDIAVLNYIGDGKFSGDGDIIFLDPSRPDSNPPDWLGWIEERYYFIAQVNGGDVCWGRHDSVSPENPVGDEPLSFYALYEFPWSQWDHLWKMKTSLNDTHAKITIDTNADGLMIHTFTDIKSIK